MHREDAHPLENINALSENSLAICPLDFNVFKWVFCLEAGERVKISRSLKNIRIHSAGLMNVYRKFH